MSLKPLNDQVLIQPEVEDTTASGIILQNQDKLPERGKVIAVGDGRLLENGTRAPMNVKVGDTVLFKIYSVTQLSNDGEQFIMVRDGEIMAIIE